MNKLNNISNKIINNVNRDILKYKLKSDRDLKYLNKRNDKVKTSLRNQEIKLKEKANDSLISIEKIAEKLKKDYDRLRLSTTPFNWLWFKYLQRQMYRNLPLAMHPGVHFIVALMGGGKSSFIYHTLERLRHTFGYGAYVNVELEHPHYDPLLREYVYYHKQFEIEDYWGVKFNEETEKNDYTQFKRFNKQYPILVLDEWLSKMNHRVNNTGNYKDIFLPFMKSLTHMRHQGINQIYIASQMDQTDVQLMSMFKYMHEVEIDLNVGYWDWVKTGKLDKHILGWNVFTYQIKRNKGRTEKVLVKKWYEKKIMDMSNFNSLNQQKEFENLPYDNIKIRRSAT